MYYVGSVEADENRFSHHGIKGMKWGTRRFQLEDGTLTTAGKERYYTGEPEKTSKFTRDYFSRTAASPDDATAKPSTKEERKSDKAMTSATYLSGSSSSSSKKKKGKGKGGGGKAKKGSESSKVAKRSEKIQARIDAVTKKHLQKKLSEIGRR